MTPANPANTPPPIPTDSAYPASTSREITVEHELLMPQQPRILLEMLYWLSSESRSIIPQINNNDNECIDDSDNDKEQGSLCSVAGPWENLGQDSQGL